MTFNQLKAIKLSEHFRASEIFWSNGIQESTLADNHKLQKIQLFLAEQLCLNILEPIREIAINEYPGMFIRILGGCRNRKSHLAMYSTNWIAPSETSDHSFMNDYYPLGVGAVDFVVSTFDFAKMKWLFGEIIHTFDSRQYGQVIFYPDSESKYIHISNPKTILGEVGKQIIIDWSQKRLEFRKGAYNGVKITDID
jgi:hypothetical protein